MINVLQLTDYLPDYPGNFGTTLISISKKIAKTNNICIITFPEERDWHAEIKKTGAKVIYIPVSKFKEKIIDINAIKLCHNIIKMHNINLVHVHFGLSQKIWTIFLKLLNPELKVVWHWRGDIEKRNFPKSLLIKIFYNFFGNYFISTHITNSANITKRLISNNIISRKKIYTLPNAINLEQFKNHTYKSNIEDFKKKYNLQEKFVLLQIRNFRERVDFSIIIDALKILQEYKDIILIWVGYGETEKIIKKKVKNLGLNNIIFVGKQTNTVPFYYASHVNLVSWEPWCNETINNSVYEALACKRPVIGFNFGGLPLAFSENEGVIFSSLNPKDYANKILFVKKNYQNVLKSVEIGYKKIKSEYSLKAYINKLFSIY